MTPQLGTPVVSEPHTRAVALAALYARLALGAAFLSAVASRFGLWAGTPGMAAFDAFAHGYGAQVLSFMPAPAIPLLLWTATAAETTFGVLLIVGVQVRWVAAGSAVLLALFGTSMAVSFGPKSPLEYSVYSASACAALVAVLHWPAAGTRRGGAGTR